MQRWFRRTGRIRVTIAQISGVYELKLDKGIERLELKGDETYVQDTVSHTGPRSSHRQMAHSEALLWWQ